MSVRRIVFCDSPLCSRSFVGTVAESRAAGWRRISQVKKTDRCPECRKRIGVRRGRQRKSELVPALPPRAVARYGAAAYMAPERLAMAVQAIVE